MGNKLRRLQKSLVLGAGTLTLLWLPSATHAQSTATQNTSEQSTATQDRQPGQNDDITRRDLARFDQFLDGHRDIADQLRRTPSLIDDPQYLQRHPELNSYLQDHPSVKQEISQQPNTFMRLEDAYDHDRDLRDRDANWQDHNAFGSDRDGNRGNGAGNVANDRDDRDRDRGDFAGFNRFLDDHREIGEQVRKNPSLCDDRDFVRNHPALADYYRDNPGVRDQLRQDPNAFMRQADLNGRDSNFGDRDAGGQDRDAFRRDAANFDRFLNDHREIGEQVRKDPSLLDSRSFVQNHPVLQAYLQDNPGVRDQVRQDPSAFVQSADRDSNFGNRDAMHDHMADFGGFLGNHSDIKRDLSRDPNVVKDHDWVRNHGELDAYLSAHPEVRADLMANPHDFVDGAQKFNNGSPTGTPGAGMNGSGTGTAGVGVGSHGTGTSAGTSTTGTSSAGAAGTGTPAPPPPATHKPNQ